MPILGGIVMAILVTEMVLEVGRMCNLQCDHCLRGECENNLQCDHCLRGECENLTMPFEIAKKAIDLVTDINTITFSGGEPTLYGKEIAKIIDYIIASKKPVGAFYIASNGTLYSPELMRALVELYAYCEEKEICRFDISTDGYHKQSYAELYHKPLMFHPAYDAFSFVTRRGELEEDYVILEGRAKDNCCSDRIPEYNAKFNLESWDKDEEDNMCEMMYVTAKGQVSPNCDLSYDTFDALDLPNINSIDSTDELIDAMIIYDSKVDSKEHFKKMAYAV
jgi:uncharacterized Fe-S cluster-containing radical SAM superfamily protein